MSIKLRQLTLAALSTAVLPIVALSTSAKPAAAAGFLVQNATVTSISYLPTSNGFSIGVSSPTGGCTNITFPLVGTDPNFSIRFYNLVFEAFENNYKVNVLATPANTCLQGGQVTVIK